MNKLITFPSWKTEIVGEFEYVDDHRAGKIVVELNGRLNKCGVISPHFDVGVKEIEGWTARHPSRQISYNSSRLRHHRTSATTPP
ncbi:40S ribosomal protein S15a-1 [Trifolium repens]|nr:40S ribosomal protein S15a-1 [Trifolium repens]